MTTQYVTGTTTGTTPADTIRTALATPMANAGWTAVETVTPGTAAHDVYKSPGASNAIGTDWFLAIGHADSTAANLQVRLFEQWDATNKKAIKYAPSATSTPASDGSVNDVTGLLLDSTSLFQHANGGGSTAVSSVTYYFNITVDRVWFATSAVDAYYYGSYDRLLSSSDDQMPLAMLKINYDGTSQRTSYGGSTRELKPAGANTYNFFVQAGYGASAVAAWGTESQVGWNMFSPGVKLQADSVYYSSAYPVGRPIVHPSRGHRYTNRGVCKPGLYIVPGISGSAGETLNITRADGSIAYCLFVATYRFLETMVVTGSPTYQGYEAKKLDAPEPAPKTTFPAATGGTTYPVAR